MPEDNMDWLLEEVVEPTHEPLVIPVSRPANTEPISGDIKETRTPLVSGWAVGIVCLTLILFLLMWRGKFSPDINPDDDAAYNGNYVLFLVDGSESGQAKLTDGQKDTINNSKWLAWSKEHKFNYKKEDTASKFDGLEKEWKYLRDNAKEAPSMTVMTNGKIGSRIVPEGYKNTIELLEKLK